jgi:hypothetical protein
MSILVHDGKQKKCISTLLTIDLQNFLTIFLTFLDFKKIIFNEIWTAVSMWKHYSKWRLANSTMSGLHKYNVMTNARLVLQHYLMNKNVGRLLIKTLTAVPILKKMWYPIGIQVK